MIKIRVVKTASASKAVQVIDYKNYKRKVLKHIGSAKDADALTILLGYAEDWITEYKGQLSFFEETDEVLHLKHCDFLGVHYGLLYETVSSIQELIGYADFLHPLLHDLVVMRLLEPASKLKSIELLAQYFGVKHSRKNYYKLALNWLDLKQQVEDKTVAFAQKEYSFSYDLVFYDVTTLYFETFEEDNLRKKGFSKDKKSDQPQILVALMVSKEGFPVSYEIFEGNPFEGNTFIPSIQAFVKRNKVKNITIVADAAMISDANVEALKKDTLNYIVGARLGTIDNTLLKEIDTKLSREENSLLRLKTEKGYLICSYSKVRYRKDKYEMEKQIQKAQALVEKPTKNKKVKFTKSSGEQLELNKALVEKVTKLLGVKGYYTDLSEEVCSNKEVIERYHQLYKIEQAFRVSKSDLETRPIFHFKEQPIKLHMLICFMALVIAKQIELKTYVSIKKFLEESKKITDARILNTITQKEQKIRVKTTPAMAQFLTSLNIPH